MTLPGHNRHPSPSLRRASRSSQARLSSSELDFSGLRLQRGLDDAAGGLWTLTFGGGGNDGSPNTLYFTDGIDGETLVCSAQSRACRELGHRRRRIQSFSHKPRGGGLRSG